MTNIKGGVSYVIDHIPRTTRQRRPGTVRVPQTLTIHSTGNLTSTARDERLWLTNTANTNAHAGWHIVVDDREAIEAIPLNEVAWHAGDGAAGAGNRFSIGIEICESGDRTKTIDNVARVVAALLREYGLPLSSIRQHHEWNRKNCPRILRSNGLWQEFLELVGRQLRPATSTNPLANAVAILVEEGVIQSPEYWLEHAKPGRMPLGDFVAVLIVNAANRIRKP